MKCIICGINDSKYENLCVSCFLKNTKFIELAESIDLTVCPHCGAIKIKKEWIYNKTLESVLSEYLLNSAKKYHEYDSASIKLSISKNLDLIRSDVTIHYKDLEKLEKFETKLQILKNSCPVCNKILGDYFESILQIRSDRDVSESEKNEIIEFVYREVRAQNNPNIFIMKYEEMHTGLDFYLSSNHFAHILVKEIQDLYSGTIKESPHLYGRKEGEDLYRITYMIRLPEYRAGDFIKNKDKQYRILNLNAKGLKVVDLNSGEIKAISQKSYIDQGYKLFAKREDVLDAILIYASGNELQIMDQQNRLYELKAPKYKVGKDLKIIKDNENVYIVPGA
ncbi:MAG: NMD3-related protein [Thermoplasmata archaeon]